MTGRELKKEERLRRVAAFLKEKQREFPSGSYGGELADEILSFLSELDRSSVSVVRNDNGKRAQVAVKADQALKLREMMRLVAKTARVIGVESPGFGKKYLMPRSGTDFELLTTGKQFAGFLRDDAVAFARYALDADFISKLVQAVEDFEAATSSRRIAGSELFQSRFERREILSRASDTARRLDVWIRNFYRNDSVRLDSWAQAWG